MNVCIFGQHYNYYRPVLIVRDLDWSYRGVLHEYLKPPGEVTKGLIKGNYFIQSGRTGARNRNPNKYADDAKMLEKALLTEQDPHMKSRYVFYLAQSYRDASMNEQAIRNYERVLTENGWIQEKYFACLQLGNLYEKAKNTEKAMTFWL